MAFDFNGNFGGDLSQGMMDWYNQGVGALGDQSTWLSNANYGKTFGSFGDSTYLNDSTGRYQMMKNDGGTWNADLGKYGKLNEQTGGFYETGPGGYTLLDKTRGQGVGARYDDKGKFLGEVDLNKGMDAGDMFGIGMVLAPFAAAMSGVGAGAAGSAAGGGAGSTGAVNMGVFDAVSGAGTGYAAPASSAFGGGGLGAFDAVSGFGSGYTPFTGAASAGGEFAAGLPAWANSPMFTPEYLAQIGTPGTFGSSSFGQVGMDGTVPSGSGYSFGSGMGQVSGGLGDIMTGAAGTIPEGAGFAGLGGSNSGLGSLLSQINLKGQGAKTAMQAIMQAAQGGKKSGASNIAPYLLGANDGYQQDQAGKKMLEWMNAQQAKVDGLYAPGSAEYNALWNEMSRKDAAAGRNSQHGPRSVDLAAKIAQIKAQNTANMTTGLSRAYSDALTQRATGRSVPGIGAAMGADGGSSFLNGIATKGLEALFGKSSDGMMSNSDIEDLIMGWK